MKAYIQGIKEGKDGYTTFTLKVPSDDMDLTSFHMGTAEITQKQTIQKRLGDEDND